MNKRFLPLFFEQFRMTLEVRFVSVIGKIVLYNLLYDLYEIKYCVIV